VVIGKLRILGELHGENKVSLDWLMETLAVFATLPHILQHEKYKNKKSFMNLYILDHKKLT